MRRQRIRKLIAQTENGGNKMRRTFSVSVVLVALAALAPLMTTLPSSAATQSCTSSAKVVLKDVSIRLPSIFGERSTIILYQVKIPVTVDPQCQTKPLSCPWGQSCSVSGRAVAQSDSGGAGVEIQLQQVDTFVMAVYGITRWVDLGPPGSCRRNGANQSCPAYAPAQIVSSSTAFGPAQVRALCHWKEKVGVVDKKAAITQCQVTLNLS